jgi:hypothetical protein
MFHNNLMVIEQDNSHIKSLLLSKLGAIRGTREVRKDHSWPVLSESYHS